MTPEQVDLVQSSFTKITPMQETAAVFFYKKLFELEPELRHVFPTDMTSQRKKMMAALATLVSGLAKPDTITPTLQALGAGHVHYGVKDEHYAAAGEALAWAIEQCLPEDFTNDMRDAWNGAYALLSGIMISAAGQARAAA